ncbi:MAG: NUDIX hydrolase [bacterium]|nr:NUDIX hydrolase [bacterium]
MSKKKIEFHTEWFDVESEEFPELPIYTGKPFYRINAPDGVVMAIFTKEEKLILVKQFRPALNKETIELPAGGVEGGEDPLESARRELMEETGYECKNLQIVARGHVTSDRMNRISNVVFGTNAIKKNGHVIEEGIEVETKTIEELRDMIMKEEMDNISGIGVLSYIKHKLNPPELKEF